jgi:hypothetical protein
MKDQQKSNLILLGPSHPHLIHAPEDAAPNCFTYTMRKKVKFYLHHEGQGLFQHISNEYYHIEQKTFELLLDSSGDAT